MKDIFELAQEEKEASQYRLNRVLCGGCPRGSTVEVRAFIADRLYHAKWDGKPHNEALEYPLSQILEDFCYDVFGATFSEVLKAWDKYLG